MQCLESASDSGLNNPTDKKALFLKWGMTRPLCLVHVTMVNQPGSYVKNTQHWMKYSFAKPVCLKGQLNDIR